MAKKLTKQLYYNKSGVSKVNNYIVSLSKSVVEQAGIDSEDQIVTYAKDGKIIIEKEK